MRDEIDNFGLHLDEDRLTIQNVEGDFVESYKVVQGIKGNHGLKGHIFKIFLKKT